MSRLKFVDSARGAPSRVSPQMRNIDLTGMIARARHFGTRSTYSCRTQNFEVAVESVAFVSSGQERISRTDI